MNYSDDLQHGAISRSGIEHALDEADSQAASTVIRHAHEEVFGAVRDGLRIDKLE